MVTVAADGATLHTRAPMKLVGRMAAAHTNAMTVGGGEELGERRRGDGREAGGRTRVGGETVRRGDAGGENDGE